MPIRAKHQYKKILLKDNNNKDFYKKEQRAQMKSYNTSIHIYMIDDINGTLSKTDYQLQTRR